MTDNRSLWELVDSGDMAKLLSLSRRTLHFAYVWNDHNFGTPKGMAKDTAIDAGLFTLDEANDFLEKFEAILELPAVVGELENAYEKGWRTACEWSKRPDMIYDIDSRAYNKHRDQALEPMVRGKS